MYENDEVEEVDESEEDKDSDNESKCNNRRVVLDNSNLYKYR